MLIFFCVAGTRFERMTFGLWAQRATTAPPRNLSQYLFCIASAKIGYYFYFCKFSNKNNSIKKDQQNADLFLCSGDPIRTNDLWVMSPTSYHCSTPQSQSIPVLYFGCKSNVLLWYIKCLEEKMFLIFVKKTIPLCYFAYICVKSQYFCCRWIG